jgi:cellulose synthase/poly-beta-1,6-N-acetylglucosamine synthase-like glycosyltransferase
VERLLAGDDVPDAVVIIDADTIMAPGFLAEVDAALDGNGAAWQAYYSVREPELSAATALRYAALALRHYVRPLGRAELGASCGLFGNGMILRTELLRNRTFSAHLTEDVEFQLELLLDGQLVGFLPSAVVEAEMPATFAAARTQNERWELGRLQLAKRFVPELLRRSCRHGGHQRIAYADAALDQLVPPLSVLAAGTGAVVAGASIAMAARRSSGRFGFRLAWASAVALAFHVIGGLRLARAPRSVYVALLQTPRLVVWKIALWVRVLVRPGSVSWRRTERNQPPRV